MQIAGVAQILDPRLKRKNFVVARHDGYGAKFEPLGEIRNGWVAAIRFYTRGPGDPPGNALVWTCELCGQAQDATHRERCPRGATPTPVRSPLLTMSEQDMALARKKADCETADVSIYWLEILVPELDAKRTEVARLTAENELLRQKLGHCAEYRDASTLTPPHTEPSR